MATKSETLANSVRFESNGYLNTNRPDAETPRIEAIDVYHLNGTNRSLLEDTTQIVFDLYLLFASPSTVAILCSRCSNFDHTTATVLE